MFPTRILTRFVSRHYLCSFDRKKVDFMKFCGLFREITNKICGKLCEIDAKFYFFREISLLEPCRNFLEVMMPHLTLLRTLLRLTAKR